MTPQKNLHETPRIYVASLSDYNAGRLHGRWIDADQEADAIRGEIAAMLAESPEPIAEDYAIHDYDNFAGYSVHEFTDVEHVSKVARLLAEHGPVFAGLLEHLGGDLNDAHRYMLEGYRGTWTSVADYAQEVAEDLYGAELEALPGFIRYHIDWDAVAHDLELGGDIFTIDLAGEVHVFDSHI